MSGHVAAARFSADGWSERGPVRPANEDAFVCDASLGLMVVADGVGGNAAGEVAARLAIETVTSFVERTQDDSAPSCEPTQDDIDATWPFGWDPALTLNANRLHTAVLLAHRRVAAAASTTRALEGMATTIVAALEKDGVLSYCSVGDSRLYLVSPRGVELLTSDDVGDAEVSGVMRRDVLVTAVGAMGPDAVSVESRVCCAGDAVVLCTDGVYKVLSVEDIAAVVSHAPGVTEAAQQLVKEALASGSRDNATSIVAYWSPVGRDASEV